MFSVAIRLGGEGCERHHRPLLVEAGLRGYADPSPLHAPPSGKPVSPTNLAATFCPTGRDLYIEKVLKVDTPSWERSVLGVVVDKLLVAMYSRGLELVEDEFERATLGRSWPDLDGIASRIRDTAEELAVTVLGEWKYKGTDQAFKEATIDDFAAAREAHDGADLVERTRATLISLIHHEVSILRAYLGSNRCFDPRSQGARARRADLRTYVGPPRRFNRAIRRDVWMADVRGTLTRLQTGVRLDPANNETRKFGISPNVCPDFLYAVTMVGDLKTGTYKAFYEDVATSYAILAEHHLKRRINTAAILSVDLDMTTKTVRSHDVKLVRPNSDLRRRWIAKRDSARRVVNGLEAPPHPNTIEPCSPCPYRFRCWEDGTPGGTKITPTPPPPPAKPPGKESTIKKKPPKAPTGSFSECSETIPLPVPESDRGTDAVAASIAATATRTASTRSPPKSAG